MQKPVAWKSAFSKSDKSCLHGCVDIKTRRGKRPAGFFALAFGNAKVTMTHEKSWSPVNMELVIKLHRNRDITCLKGYKTWLFILLYQTSPPVSSSAAGQHAMLTWRK